MAAPGFWGWTETNLGYGRHALWPASTVRSRALAVEWAEHGIRVNAVAPGLTETPGVRELVSTTEGRLEHEGKIKMVPLGRACEPREVARVVLFLAAAGSAYITGETIFVDGGYSAGRMVPA